MKVGLPRLTVIIPTYNEKDNVALLIPALYETLTAEGIPYEILVLDDDSPDGTAAEVERLSRNYSSVRCVVRKSNRGLSPAVIEGLKQAQGEIILIMDADLSHPVEAVPKLYMAITRNSADVAVGSRHTKGGRIEHWTLKRKVISWGASLLARPLTSCSDPLSGFFALRSEVIKDVPLKAKGYKILLEVLVKGNYQKMVEVPISFTDRKFGKSKLGSTVIFNYFNHLIRLYAYPGSTPFLKFIFVGSTGMLIDLASFTFFLLILGERLYLLCQGFSFLCAVTWNFFWNRLWTFDAREGRGEDQYIKFFSVAFFAFIIRSGLMYLGVDIAGISGMPWFQVLLFIIIVIVTVINYFGSKMWAFKD